MKALPAIEVLACQIAIPARTNRSDRDANLAGSVAMVRSKLSERPADMVALPELSAIDYSRDAFDRLAELAEPLDGPSLQAWREVAREHATHVAYSFPRVAGDGFRISLAVVGPSGDLVGHFDKLHLAQYGASMEKEYFGAGDHLFVFDIKGIRIAPIICYDIRMPELSRTLAIDHGVDMILHAGAYSRDPSFYSWHQFVVARAMENQVFVLSLNRAGADFGHSIFCPPWVDEDRQPIVFAKHDEQILRLEINRAEIERARATYSFVGDRRDCYDLPVIGQAKSAMERVK